MDQWDAFRGPQRDRDAPAFQQVTFILSRRPVAMLVAIAVALAAGWIAGHADHPTLRPDVDQLWFAARAILDGRDPYALIGPGREFAYPWPLFYPLPAALFLVPLASFPVVVARIAIAALPAGLLAYLIARTDPRGLVLFLSWAFYVNAWYAQWTPLLLCALYLPALGFFAAAKPSVGLAILAGARNWRHLSLSIGLAALITIASLLVLPTWPAAWLKAIATGVHLRPWVTVPGGFLLLLSLLRWRRWEGRLLAAIAIVPQTFHPLATLPVILLPASFRGKLLLALLTYVPGVLLVREPWGPRLATATEAEIFAVWGRLILWTVLIPALFFVLRLPDRRDDMPGRPARIP